LNRATGAMELRHVTFSYGADRNTGVSPVLATTGNGEPIGAPDRKHGRDDRVTDAPIVLHDVSIRIEPGRTVALCGPSGSGKSTILNLLLRFYDPTRGIVTLDGRDVRSITRESLHRH